MQLAAASPPGSFETTLSFLCVIVPRSVHQQDVYVARALTYNKILSCLRMLANFYLYFSYIFYLYFIFLISSVTRLFFVNI
jgi:hypothetical protein